MLGPAGRQKRKVHAVTSARSGIGKTLYARLLCMHLAAAKGQPLVFDTDAPDGDLAQFDEMRAEVVDLSRVEGQMRLFDSLLVTDYDDAVVDLSKSAASVFEVLGTELGLFDPEAQHDLAFLIHFLIDPTERAMAAARHWREAVPAGRLVVVENRHAIDPKQESFPESYWQIEPYATVGMPSMPVVGNALLTAREAGFASFRRGEWSSGSIVLDHTLKRFLDVAFEQFKRLELKMAVDDSGAFG